MVRLIADSLKIPDSDRTVVCLSGEDSNGLSGMLIGLQRTAPIMFELVAVNLGQKGPGFAETVLPMNFSSMSIGF